MSKRIRILIILLVFTVGITGFYILGDNWTLLDALYMTVITITTVGYGEVKPLTPEGHIFTIFFIILGLSTAAILATQLAGEFIENNFKAIFGAGKMRKKIKKLSNHYIVCGFGDIGSSISKSLKEAEIPFVVIENSTQNAEYAQLQNYLVVLGKATYDATLLEAGLMDARGIVVCLGDDSLNMYVTLAAREMKPDLLIFVRGYKDGGEKRMIRAGANSVIYPLKLGGQQMAQQIISEYSKKNKTSQLEVTTSGILGYSLRLYKHLKEKETTVGAIVSFHQAARALKMEKKGGVKIKDPTDELIIVKNDRILLLMDNDVVEDLEELEDADYLSEYQQFGWSEEYLLNIPSVDEEHQNLVALINNFIGAIHTKDEKKAIVSTFENLLNYTAEHFKNEEAFMEKHQFPLLEEHRKIHERLTREVEDLNRKKDYIFPDSIADFLISWLTDHIMGEDKKYADFVLTGKLNAKS